MNHSKNKKRRQKISCIVSILFLIILISGYYLWSFNALNKSGEAVKITTDKVIESKKNHTKKDEDLIYKEILGNNQITHFTGIEISDNTTLTDALFIESIDSSSIKYRIETLINWKSKNNKKGIAVLDKSSIGSQKWKIENKKGDLKSAFRFIDKKSDCLIEIFISKGNYRKSVSIVKEICKEKSKLVTTKMSYK